MCLLATPNKVVPAARLIDELWGDEPPETAANVLQSYVSQLRKALGKDAIETRGQGYAARVEPGALDLIAFERAAHTGPRCWPTGSPRRPAIALREALALWRGPALADLADEPAVRRSRPGSTSLRLARARAADRGRPRRCGRHAEVVGGGRRAGRASTRFASGLRRLHMLALYRVRPPGRGARRLP